MTSIKFIKYHKLNLLVVILGLVIACTYHTFQQPNNFRESELSDAIEYEKIYNYFNGNTENYQVRYGIHNRIIIPYLAALFSGNNPETSFSVINTFCALLSLLAIFYLMRSYQVRPLIIFLTLCYFSFHWVGPFRQNAISPLNVDMGVYLFEVLFLLLFIKRKYLGLLIISPIAIATKEIFLAYLVVFFIVGISWKFLQRDKKISVPWIFCILLTGIITKLLLNHFFPSVSPGRNSVIVLAFHAREMLLHPDHLLRWVLGLFAAFGAFLFLLDKRGINTNSISDNEIWLHSMTLAALALSAFGGMDYTRLIFLGFPFIMLSIILLSKPTNIEFLIVFIISMIITRFWIILPDPSSDLSLYNLWMPEYADTNHLWIWTIVAISCFLLTIIARRFYSVRD